MLRNYWPLSYMKKLSSGGGGAAPSLDNPTPIALVNRTSTVSVSDSSAITYNAEQYDNESVIAVPATTMTIPSAGLYRVHAAAYTSNNKTGSQSAVGGSLVAGSHIQLSGSNTPQWSSGQSAILSLASSAAVTTQCRGGTTNFGNGGSEYTWMGLERLDPDTWYAHVRKSADQTSFSSGNVTWATEVADVGGWADLGTNNTRLTVPSGISRVRLSANFTLSSSVFLTAQITKNGSSGVRGLPVHHWDSGVHQNLAGPAINVSAGDYFELNLALAASRDIKNNVETWFQIEQVPSGVKSCLVYNSTGQNIGTSDAMLSWDSEDHDPDGMHSTSSNTSRLTVPSGCTYARLFFQVKGELNDTARVQAQVKKNGGAGVGTAIDCEIGAVSGYQELCGVSAWMAVTSGDYFELQCSCSSGTVTTSGGWFAMECI